MMVWSTAILHRVVSGSLLEILNSIYKVIDEQDANKRVIFH